jgi:hypothetical protein
LEVNSFKASEEKVSKKSRGFVVPKDEVDLKSEFKCGEKKKHFGS